MRQTWRWFGPQDVVPLSWIRQAGAVGVVSACHDIPSGAPWTQDAVATRKAMIEKAGLSWDVIESVPVSEAIKTGGPDAKDHIGAYIDSLHAIAQAQGPKVVCYNFMPVLDWTRTHTDHPLPNGGTAMAFSLLDFAVFDLFILKRARAEADYPKDLCRAARARYDAMPVAERDRLATTVGAGLPGANDAHATRDLPNLVAAYDDLGEAGLRETQVRFLRAVVPAAEELGLRLCAHPDDPPFPILGLPRILSTANDYQAMLDAAPSAANGITFCAGSLGVRADIDLPAFVARFAPHIHFVHLRNTTRSGDVMRPDFIEDAHLDGDTDMVAVLRALLAEEARRKEERRTDAELPMRPDHGHRLMGDLDMPAQPGYPAVGRLRGLAELRGVLHALQAV